MTPPTIPSLPQILRARGGFATGPTRPDPYLDDLVRTLWPEPVRIVWSNRSSRPRGSTAEYIIVPNARRPKLVLPRRPRRVTAAALRNVKASATGMARLKLRALSFATRIGLADVLPDRLNLEADLGTGPSGIDVHLATVLDRQMFVSIYIGPSRAVAKPVLQLLTPAGESFGFAKIGTNALTRRLVRTEAEALLLLGACEWSKLTVPAVLHHGQWHHHEVLVQQALTGSGSGRVAPADRAAAMAELARVHGVTSQLAFTGQYGATLRARIDGLTRSRYATILGSALDRLVATPGKARLDFGSWHGDWSPWNMTLVGSRVGVWDWEQFETGVPLGYDALHYRVQQAVVQESLRPEQALEQARLEAPDLLAPFGVSRDDARVVMALYTVDIATRYLEDGEVEAGTRMGRLDTWLEPVLGKQIGLIERESAR